MTLLETIRQSTWWKKAEIYNDRHHDPSTGIMLSDHLNAVAAAIDSIFDDPNDPFLSALFSIFDQLGLDKEKTRYELQVVSLLHDIGKPEEEKAAMMEHPLNKELVSSRHPVLGVQAAMEILTMDLTFSDTEKARIYHLVNEHDTPFSMYRQFQKNNIKPAFKTLKKLNDKIDAEAGAGLLYLLIFKLADIDGHKTVDDVTWFFTVAKQNYYDKIGLDLPVPGESDIRMANS